MKKISMRLMILITGIIFLTACGKKDDAGTSNTGTAAGGQVTVEFMHSMVEQERLDQINEIIAEFEKENPDIKIKQIPVDEDS